MNKDNLKAIFVSSVFVVVFIAYVIHERNENAQALNQVKVGVNQETPIPSPSIQARGKYKNGTYLGDATDAFYGTIQVKAVITNGKISDVVFLQYPNDRETSIQISRDSMPVLKSEAIAAQSAKVDIVSGATQTSEAFVKSLQSALNKAI